MLRLISVIAVLVAGVAAAAEVYPSRSVSVVVTFGAGGPADSIMRIVGGGLSQRLGVPIIVENRLGAGGMLGVEAVIKSKSDGYTLVALTNSTSVIAPLLMKEPLYDSLSQTTPIGCVADYQMFLVTAPDYAGTIKELIEKNPKNWGSASAVVQLAGVQFARLVGINAERIPYKGEPEVVSAVLSGTVQYGFVHGPTVRGQIDAGKVRALAVIRDARSPFFPSVPTMAEAGVAGLDELATRTALAGPKGISPETVGVLSKALAETLRDKDVIERLGKISAAPWACSPEDLQAWIARNKVFVGKLIDDNAIPRH